MDDGYDHQLPTSWNGMYQRNAHHGLPSSYVATGHSAYQPLTSNASPLTMPSGYSTMAQTSSLQSSGGYIPGPPVSSGPQYALSTSSLPNTYAHAPVRTQPEIQQSAYGGLPMPSQYGHPQYQQRPMNSEPEPLHVVGQQGRRGVLPSAPGRPPASSGKTTGSFNKDEDGKYPCQHCAKTYQHAKHLKRHMLRHTGDRPYQCVLCSDTFSRSDILKRHFQKCSQRRGNPHGATHLSGSQAHLRRNTVSKSNEDGFMSTSSTPALPSEGTFSGNSWPVGNGLPDQAYPSSLPASSNRPSRSNSTIFSPTDISDDGRRNMSSLDYGGSREYALPSSGPAEMGHGMAAYGVPHGQAYYDHSR